MALAARPWAAELLHVWFRVLRPSDWFGSSDAVDKLLAERFADDLARLGSCGAEDFLDEPGTARAAILLFDQVPRNLFRDDPRAFAHDPLARALTHGVMRRGWHRGLDGPARQFIAMPLMHSEDIADQLLALRFFAQEGLHEALRFSRAHYRMIARFGRFPHRNATLGRTSTPAERKAIEAGFAW